MATPRTIPWDRDPHTEAKHEILRRYLEQWFPKLMHTPMVPGVIYLEGFAGPGVYTKGEPGSPIIARRTFRGFPQLLETGKPVQLVLNDNDPRCVHRLRQEMAKDAEQHGTSPPTIRTHYSTVECDAGLIDRAAATARPDTPMFAFLDSFGGPDIGFDVLTRVAARRSSEVLLTFGPRFLIQFGQATQYRSLGDAVFGGQDWQQLYEQMPSDKRTFLVTAYLAALRGAGFTFTLHFELLDEGGHPLFLLFGTTHHKGLHAMKTAMWSVDPVTGARYRDPRDPDQQALDLAWEPDLGPLRRMLLAELRQGPRTIAQLRDFTLFETMYRPEQVGTAVDQLRERRQVRATPNHRRLTKTAVIRATGEEPMFD